MESLSRAALPFSLGGLLLLTGIHSTFISVPSILHGVRGRPLLLPVKYNFTTANVEIQGDWKLHDTMLVAFRNRNVISHLSMEHQHTFLPPNASLLINVLEEKAEGPYKVDIRLKFADKPDIIEESRVVRVTVNVPVSKPNVHMSPGSPVVEDKDNVTWTCSVDNGSHVQYRWFRDGVPVGTGDRYSFSGDNGKFAISPVRKEDIGDYVCQVSNHVSEEWSRPVPLSVFYGPYNLEVSAQQGLKTGEVFTINPGELVLFDCHADSNPPNTCVWISKSRNSTKVVMKGPRLEVMSERLAQAEEYVCRAFNNVTQKQDETQFTLVVASLGTGKAKHLQTESSVPPLAVITVSCLIIIACMLLVLFRRSCRPHRVIMDMYSRNHKPLTDQKRAHLSGHEDATEDFGIYEFVTIPGRSDSTQASSKSLSGLNSVQDLHSTIYDVIRHIPETPTQGLLK
ncbi:HEPACAM family member 2 [Paramormyrops kingsleyae]|uniref:HEPACAM family member 2 n=1 Tax=Paramormyrops kingsleyae TaxID=1676925 RepID=A0A3B3R6P7_9TELE|nr:HEPACAM family member 2 [Paramormyrops kingsleyae]